MVHRAMAEAVNILSPLTVSLGAWMPKIENISLCNSGYHIVEFAHLLDWRGSLLCTAEIRGEQLTDGSKTVAQEIRLLRVIKEWNKKNLRLFAADCAERVLPIFEKKHPNDKRPRLAIQAARAFTHGKISARVMLDARHAAAYTAADARSKERAWQINKLKEYLKIK
jgi:hypothetical protein